MFWEIFQFHSSLNIFYFHYVLYHFKRSFYVFNVYLAFYFLTLLLRWGRFLCNLDSIICFCWYLTLSFFVVYGDEQAAFKCSTDVVGCQNICYNEFAKISHMRFWAFQVYCFIKVDLLLILISSWIWHALCADAGEFMFVLLLFWSCEVIKRFFNVQCR